MPSPREPIPLRFVAMVDTIVVSLSGGLQFTTQATSEKETIEILALKWLVRAPLLSGGQELRDVGI